MSERRKVHDRRQADDSLRARVEFALRAMLGAYLIIFGIVVAMAVALHRFENERAERSESVAGHIALTCETDNDQDRLLAKLVRVSLEGGTFGANIDPSDLTPADVAVLGSIAKVQALAAEAPPTQQQRVFESELENLDRLTPCQALVARYLSGEQVPTTAELNSIEARSDRGERKSGR